MIAEQLGDTHRQDFTADGRRDRKTSKMSTTRERKPFIAPVIDVAAEFIKKRGAVTVSELAVYLSAVGVNVRGDDEFTGKELAYLSRYGEVLGVACNCLWQ
ncbi:hypothetical protein BN971_01881 [Mycobacterium bohemicum DSM 44277]|uniref:Uncharacterized protein n=1 Tax=Mycobacterium bohemicum DSM 44277 TaxID=1236609 RepID=A0A0U0W6V4_MYCBE|nr:hypothetical protein [Mycobacterium bohemicum]MCV6970089.1 hypothetical protein [Mycobacterium bohemicum]CPR10492.1 hypothetical protein BN971_01881 [Mycobacterium bohemicum DSM 44277]